MGENDIKFEAPARTGLWLGRARSFAKLYYFQNHQVLDANTF
jgi:hypothetical protein